MVAAGEADSLGNVPVPAGQDEKAKKGHRRGRSFTGLIPTLKTKPKRSASELLPVCHQAQARKRLTQFDEPQLAPLPRH